MTEKIRVNSDDAFAYLESRIGKDEQLKHRKLVNILKEGFEGISESQCSGIIYRAHNNKKAILKKEGSNYRLLTKDERNTKKEGLEKVKELINEFVEEIENIPGNQFKDYDEFSKYKQIIERVNNIKSMI